MKKYLLITFAISILSFGCNNNQTKPDQEKKTQTETETETDEHDHSDGPIELNNGQKWKVDDNMMVHIRNMENDISNFNTGEITDYKVLSDKLLNNVDLLTSNCTMKGKAHDELHKWLLPYIDLVNEFSEIETMDNATAYFPKLQLSFSTFNQYFQ